MSIFKIRFGPVIILLLSVAGCTVEPKPIEYGTDACTHCMMNIVDDQHAAQLVTGKGKVYKFDAIECMVNELKKESDTDFAYQLVCDFRSPGKLIDARSAQYLISENLPSPMGAYLSAFSSEPAADSALIQFSGQLHTWEELFVILQ